jgi:hypothetical protein
MPSTHQPVALSALLFQSDAALGAGLGVTVAFGGRLEANGAAWRHGAVDLRLIGQCLPLRAGKAATDDPA